MAGEELLHGGLGTAAKEDTVREVDGGFAGALEAGDDVENEGEVAVLLGRNAKLEAFEFVVVSVEAIAPRLEGERRIGDDEIEGL